MRYLPHEMLVAPARTRAELWRLAIGIVLCVVFYALGLMVYRRLVAALFSLPEWGVDLGLGNPVGPQWTLVLLYSFIPIWIAVFVVLRLLHRRSALGVIGNASDTLRGFLRAAGAVLLLYVVLEILPPHDPFNVVENEALRFGAWALLLPLSVTGIVIQTGAEELLFRGYIQSQLAARFRAPLIWIGVPAALFAVLHYDPITMGANAVIVVAWAFAFGVLAADLTARSGTLGPAMGFHFANNAFAMLYMGFSDNFGGLALYHLPFRADQLDPASPLILLDFAIVGISWLAVRVAIRR